MGAYGERGGVPRVVRDCVTFLRETGEVFMKSSTAPAIDTCTLGMQEVGLFRRSPKSVLLTQVQEAYDRGALLKAGHIYR